MKFGYLSRFPVVFLFGVICWTHSCRAQGVQTADFQLGGTNWAIPISYLDAQSPKGVVPQSFTLRFELPSFKPANAEERAENLTPDGDAPILLVTISDDPKAIVGQALLNQFMAKADVTCNNCVGDSSLGGKEYSNYSPGSFLANLPVPDSRGIPFTLYVNDTENGKFFFVCSYTAHGQATHCEVKQRLENGLMLTYQFPRDLVSQIFVIDTKLKIILSSFEKSSPSVAANGLSLLQTQPTCWAPQTGSDGAQTKPLQVGPELWHIPRAYLQTYGLDQTNNPHVNGFMIWLKLPDLEPISSDDPSPYAIHGFYKYISIFMNYQNDAMRRHPWISKGSDGHLSVVGGVQSPYVGKSRFLDYEILSEFGGYDPDLVFISNNLSQSYASFPPILFECGSFVPGKSARCHFDVDQKTNNPVSEYPDAGYIIAYSFSRDYFSQIDVINTCVQRLYESFSDYKERN